MMKSQSGWLSPGVLVASACLIFSMLLSGCDNAAAQARNEAERLTEKAAAEIERISLSTVYPMSAEVRDEVRQQYAQFLNSLNVPPDAMPEQKAQLDALATQAHLALAHLHGEDARDLESSVSNRMNLVIQKLGAAIGLDAMADASQKIDYSSTKSQLDQQEQMSRQRQNDLRQEANALQSRINDLENEIQTELNEYERLTNQSAEVHDQALEAPLDGRRALLEEAATISRRADSHQVRAANLEALLDTIKPELATIQARIAQTETEVMSFEASRKALTDRENLSSQNAAARRQDAQAVVSEIKNELDAIYTREVPQLLEKYHDAENALDQAISTAASAQRSSGGTVRYVQALQAKGDLFWRKAQFFGSYEQFISRLADESALLGRGDEDRARLQGVRTDIEEARQTAAEAYTSAIEEANAIAAREVDEKTIRRLISGLNEHVVALTGESAVDESKFEMPEEETGTGAAPTARTEPTGDPSAVLRLAVKMEETGDYTGVENIFHADNEGERQLMQLIGRMAGAVSALNRECEAKFGQTFTEAAEERGLGNGLMPETGQQQQSTWVDNPFDPLEGLTNEQIDGFEFAYDNSGTASWITNDPNMSDLVFVQVDGGDWKIDLNMNNQTSEEAEAASKFVDAFVGPFISVIDDFATRTEAGEFASMDQMMSAIEARMQEVMAEALGEMFKQMQGEGGLGGGG